MIFSFKAEIFLAALTKRSWCYVLCTLVNMGFTLRLANNAESEDSARQAVVLTYCMYFAAWPWFMIKPHIYIYVYIYMLYVVYIYIYIYIHYTTQEKLRWWRL